MTRDTTELLFEHRKKTRAEGYEALFWITFTCVGLGVMPLIIVRAAVVDLLFTIFWYGIIAIVGAIGVTYAVLNIRAGGVFSCRLTAKLLECKCPVSAAGDSFAVKIARITHIEKVEWSESYRWYIWDDCEGRYWLTANYDNPADEFVELIKQMRPALRDDRLI